MKAETRKAIETFYSNLNTGASLRGIREARFNAQRALVLDMTLGHEEHRAQFDNVSRAFNSRKL